MTKTNGTCNRCKGSGFYHSPVVHLGIPGLCYGCDGDGTYVAFAAKRAAARKAKEYNDAYHDTCNMVSEVAEKNGGRISFTREIRVLLRSMPVVFTSEDWSKARGISKKEAFLELCRVGPGQVSPVVDNNLKAVGWAIELSVVSSHLNLNIQGW